MSWRKSRTRRPHTTPQQKEFKKDGNKFCDAREKRQVIATLFEAGRNFGLRGKGLVNYVKANSPP
jgi:hypothetical protein